MIHSKAVPVVRSVVPVTGLPSPPSEQEVARPETAHDQHYAPAPRTRERGARARRDPDADEREHREGRDVEHGHLDRFAWDG
jgi:hypothetical protein